MPTTTAALPPAHFEAIVRIAADAIVSIDASHRIVLFNRGAELIFGYRASEILGQPLNVLLPEAARHAHDAHVRTFAGSEIAARLMSERRPVQGRRKNGELFPADASISHTRIDGRSYFTAVVRDVTERRQAEAERRALLKRERRARREAERGNVRAALLARVSATLSGSLDYETTLAALGRFCVPELAALCIIDVLEEDGTLRRLEASHDAVADHSVGDARANHSTTSIGAFVTRTALLEGRSTLVREITEEDLLTMARDDEHLALWRSVSPTSYVCAPLKLSGQIMGAIGFVSGQGRRRYDGDDLRLVEEIALRAALALDNARLYGQARRATALRDEVLGVVSHDLRNPLAALSMGLTRLEAEPEATPARRAELLNICRASADWMERMLRDLLDVASIDAGRLSIDREPTDIVMLVVHAQSLFDQVFAEHDIDFVLDVPERLPRVDGDPERILQLLSNLLANASKYTPEHGRVILAAREHDGEILMSVQDTGPGIPREHLPYLFDRFWHARGSARTRGAGLGLSIAKGIADAHGGRIWVETTERVGSTFSVTLPLARPATVRVYKPPDDAIALHAETP